MEVQGIIIDIEYRNTGGHEKKVVTIDTGYSQVAFIDFRGKKMELLRSFKEKDWVAIGVTFEGKTSKNSGIQFNNIVAGSIQLQYK